MRDLIGDLGFWLYIFAWLPYTLIAIYYGLGSPWYESAIGRSFWFSKVALSLLLSFVLSVLIFGRYPWLEQIRAGLLTLMGVAAWYQFLTVRRIQREARANPDGHPRRRKDDYQPKEKP